MKYKSFSQWKHNLNKKREVFRLIKESAKFKVKEGLNENTKK